MRRTGKRVWIAALLVGCGGTRVAHTGTRALAELATFGLDGIELYPLHHDRMPGSGTKKARPWGPRSLSEGTGQKLYAGFAGSKSASVRPTLTCTSSKP